MDRCILDRARGVGVLAAMLAYPLQKGRMMLNAIACGAGVVGAFILAVVGWALTHDKFIKGGER